MNFKEPINIGELDAAQRLELARNPELFIAKRRIAELEGLLREFDERGATQAWVEKYKRALASHQQAEPTAAMEGNGEFVGEAPCIAVKSTAQISITGCHGTVVGTVSIDREELKRLQRAEYLANQRYEKMLDTCVAVRRNERSAALILERLLAGESIGGPLRKSAERVISESVMPAHLILDAPRIPEGFVLVPVELTDEMANAFHEAKHGGYIDSYPVDYYGPKYRAMLAAAPKGGSHE